MSLRESCPACACGKTVRAFDKEGYRILMCKECQSLFVGNVPSPEEIAEIYASADYYELPRDSVKRIDRENRRRIKRIKQHIPAGSFLDIGCARGGLLDLAKEAGFKTYGVEPTPANAAISSKNGHEVFNGWLSDFAHVNQGKRFDVITCLDVIEHIEFPIEFMRIIVSLMGENGLLVLSTPNYSGVVAKKLQANDPYMTPPEHLNFFTRRGLQMFATRCELHQVEYTNFGSLTRAETERSIQRYLPWIAKPLYPAVHGGVNVGFRVANWLGMGLEQEVYLNKYK